MTENNNRIQIDDETVVKIAGGRICYGGQGESGVHFMWSNKNPIDQYAFNFEQMPAIGAAIRDCYGKSDDYTFDYLQSKGLIWKIQ